MRYPERTEVPMNASTRCRMCLAQCEDDDLTPMLTTWNDSINLWSMYDFIMNVGENADSASAPLTCKKCKEDLKSAYDFKLRCVETERKLTELVKIEQSASESEVEYVLYDDDDDDDLIEEGVKEYEVEGDCFEGEVEALEDDCVDENVEAVIDAELCDTNDEDLWNNLVEEKINRVTVKEEVDGEPNKSVVAFSCQCRACKIQFENKKLYQIHYRQVHQRKYQRVYHKDNPRSCPTCNIRFDNVKQYMVHYRQHHQRRAEKPDREELLAARELCTFCGKLLSKSSLWKHIQMRHSDAPKKEFPCTICGRKYKYIENLTMHMRTHKNDKRFACDVCGEKFLHWATRRSHVRSKHTGVKHYECHICGDKFSHSSNMYRHIRRHQNELPHNCSSCSKGFLTKAQLADHQIVHTKVKNEACEICQKKFGTRKNLKAHMRIHSGEKNYVCSVCDKRFTQPHVLRTHLKTHPGVKMPERGVVLSQKALSRLENVAIVSVNEN